MSELDTDPQMLRDQQNRDAPETIEPREADAKGGRSDSDDRSRRDRERAQRGEDTQGANETMDDVFAGNREAAGSTEDRMMADAATDGNASLAQSGRSLLADR